MDPLELVIKEFRDNRVKRVFFCNPTITQLARFTVDSKGKISSTAIIKESDVFYKITTCDVNMCLFMTKNMVDKKHANLKLVSGTEHFKAYNDIDNNPQVSITLTPSLLYNYTSKVRIEDKKTLSSTFEILKFIIDHYHDKDIIDSCEMTEQSLHDACRMVYSIMVPEKDYDKLS